MFKPMRALRSLHPKQICSTLSTLGSDLHHDQRGSISIASVFAFLFLTMLMGLVINTGLHVDRKVKIQNAADAATYSGSTIVARSMNTLTFTNYLLCDVFAMTAFLREARDRNAESLTIPVLDQWDEVALEFDSAGVPKFEQLTAGIPLKTDLERALLLAIGDYHAAVAEQLLPVCEEILASEAIPEFQRALADTTPQLANLAANEIANRHGPAGSGVGSDLPMNALMWRTDAMPFGTETLDGLYQIPVADPVNDQTEFSSTYFEWSRNGRYDISFSFLRTMNNIMLLPLEAPLRRGRTDKFVPPEKFFGGVGYHNGAAKLSQFATMWRGFTEANLHVLLEEEYPNSNLPFVIRESRLSQNEEVETDFMFVGVAYWAPFAETMPGLFGTSSTTDQVAFAQAQLYTPQNRWIQRLQFINIDRERSIPSQGVYFFEPQPPQMPSEFATTNYPRRNDFRRFFFRYTNYGPIRGLWNQHWSTQLVPATTAALPTILETPPPELDYRVPSLGGLTVDEFRQLNTH